MQAGCLLRCSQLPDGIRNQSGRRPPPRRDHGRTSRPRQTNRHRRNRLGGCGRRHHQPRRSRPHRRSVRARCDLSVPLLDGGLPNPAARDGASLDGFGRLIPGAFFLRGALAIVAYTAKAARGLTSYNVDVRSFIYWAGQVADGLPALLDIRPFHFAGTYDVGFHYFLALVLWLPGGSLLAAQVLVVLAGTLSAWLVYRIARPLVGRAAVVCGVALAIAPNAVFLASADLMKDCLLTFAFLLAIFAGQRLYDGSRIRPAWLLVLAGSFATTRSIRVYAGALLECGLVGLPLIAWWRGRRSAAPGPAGGITIRRIVLVFAIWRARRAFCGWRRSRRSPSRWRPWRAG